MTLAKVRGNIVSTHKNEYLKGNKLMIIRQIDLQGKFTGNDDIVALDLIDSGIGDTVLIVQEGDAVQQILGHNKAPVHTMIVALVDQIDF
jgi:microcompartment protein CcmK/EutM